MDKHGARIPQARVRFPKHEKKGQGCKQKDACPQKAMISRLKGLAPPEQFSLSLSLSLFSRACIRVPIHVPPFIFMLLVWATFLGYGNVCFTFPIPCWAIPLGCWQCLLYFPALCDSIMHDVCVCVCIYIYMPIFRWLCTLNDGLSWLHKRPSLVTSALDLVEWVCAEDNCCRCIFMLYCVHNYRSVIVLIHVTKWHRFPHVCDTHQYVWYFKGLRLVLAWACWHMPYTQAWNLAGVP